METVTVKILQNTIANAKAVKKGETVTVSLKDGHILTNLGRAKYIDRKIDEESIERVEDSSNGDKAIKKK